MGEKKKEKKKYPMTSGWFKCFESKKYRAFIMFQREMQIMKKIASLQLSIQGLQIIKQII